MNVRLKTPITGLLLNSFIDRFYYLKPHLYLNKLKLISIIASEQQYFNNKILSLTYLNLTTKLIFNHNYHTNLFILPNYGYKYNLTNASHFYNKYNFKKVSKIIKLQCLFKVILNNLKIRQNFKLNNKIDNFTPEQHLYSINHTHKILYILDQNSTSQINYLLQPKEQNKNLNFSYSLYFEFCRNILSIMDSEFIYLVNLNSPLYSNNLLNFFKNSLNKFNLSYPKDLVNNHKIIINSCEKLLFLSSSPLYTNIFNTNLD
jgi:hypothetical protein